MSIVVEKDYKGYEIHLDNKSGEFTASLPGEHYNETAASASNLSDLKSKLDKLSKAMHFDPPKKVIIYRNEDIFLKGSITSMRQKEEKWDRKPVIVFRVMFEKNEKKKSWGNPTWEDCEEKELIKPTPENLSEIAMIIDTQKQMENLRKKMEKDVKALVRYTKEELLE